MIDRRMGTLNGRGRKPKWCPAQTAKLETKNLDWKPIISRVKVIKINTYVQIQVDIDTDIDIHMYIYPHKFISACILKVTRKRYYLNSSWFS